MRGASAHGLDPDDYHRPEIERLLAAPRSEAERVQLDLLLTDALVRLAYHLAFGKVDPERLEPAWNASRDLDEVDPVDALRRAIGAEDVATAVAAFAPTHPLYARFQAALAHYRGLAARGAFPTLAAGRKLALGDEGPRVAALRGRLAAEGDLPAELAAGSRFDAECLRAVKRAQVRLGLDPDGVVGRATLAALNVPVLARVDQIRLNLERARWVLHAVRGRLVLVDVAGFHLHVFDGDDELFTTRVVVGRPYRRTPSFRSAVRTLVLNPTWTVPPTILREDVLPAVRRDRGYLARHHLRVLDSRGREVGPDTVDWSTEAERFPYTLRQDAGPDNPLGRIKFVFPNAHTVYLHDTPARELFGRAERAFSSGCIRVEDALTLAVLLLDDPVQWSREALEAAIATEATRTVTLHAPVAIRLVYWTIDVEADGTVFFMRDLYARDAALLAALDGDFSFRRRPVAGRASP